MDFYVEFSFLSDLRVKKWKIKLSLEDQDGGNHVQLFLQNHIYTYPL